MSYAVKQIKMPIPMPEAAQDRAGNPAARGSISASLFEPIIAPDPLKRIAASPLATLVWADDPRYRETECFAQRLAEHGVRILAVDYAAALAETRQNRDGLAADAAAQLCAANQVAAVLRWVDAHYGGAYFRWWIRNRRRFCAAGRSHPGCFCRRWYCGQSGGCFACLSRAFNRSGWADRLSGRRWR